MSTAYSIFPLLLLLVVFTTEGTLFGHFGVRCQFSSYDGHNAVYLEQYYLNKMLMMQYNSTLGEMVGYTQKTKEYAIFLNQNEQFMTHEKWKSGVCKRAVPLAYDGLLTPVELYINLRSVEAASSKHPGLLVCSVYNFYPKQIKVTWLRDGREITSGVTSTDELSNGNWLYQLHSHLEYTPRPGEKITCMVEHASFKQPKLHDWDPLPDQGRIKIIFGTSGMLLGLFLSVAGIIYYKKKLKVNHLSSHGSRTAPSARPETLVVQESAAFLEVLEMS